MPTRQAVALAERRSAPAAVLTLVGSWEPLTYGYSYYNRYTHIEGPSGPRGGRKTVCGQRINKYWITRDLRFPVDQHYDYRDPARWRNACPECKTGLGTTLNA